MGGADAVLAKARESYAKGEYRWVAEVVNHVVFAEPDNQDARNLQADALEQLGYQRSEEHTSELQSLMRTSYAVFCLKKKTTHYTPLYSLTHLTSLNHQDHSNTHLHTD